MKPYLRIWIALLLLTAVEVVLAYLRAAPGIMLVALIGLSTLKAALIIGWFMHLKFERRSLFLALIPALVAFILILSGMLPDAARALQMRPQ